MGDFLLPITPRAPFGYACHPNRDDWAVVRVLHWYSQPYFVVCLFTVCCWFSPLLREVFLRVLRFSPLVKTNISKFQFDRNQVDEEPLCGCATSKSLFIYLFIYYAFKTSVLRRRFLMSQGGWGEGQRQRAGQDGKGIERKRLLLFLLGYSAGVSADETRERNSNPQ